MPAIPLVYLPPPTPFGAKCYPGTRINRRDVCSAHLVWCWPFNEGHGNLIAEVGDPYQRRHQRWGPDTVSGTGTDIPQWTFYEQAQGLRVFSGSNQQKLTEAYTPQNPTPPKPHSFINGITVEFWGKSLVIGTSGNNFAMLQIGTFNFGNVAELAIGAGQNGFPCYRFSHYGTEVVHTPFTTPENLIFQNHQSLPNHVIVSVTPGGHGSIYGNGRLITRMLTPFTPFASGGDLNTVFVKIGTNTNFAQGNFEGVIWKVSVYDKALGDATAATLAKNPMRVLYGLRQPGTFQPTIIPPGGGGDDTGQGGEPPICELL